MAAVADVSDSAAVGSVIDAVMTVHGRLDVVVNNAGIVSPMLHFFEADEDWWRRIIDVNLTGHFLVSHPAARIMAKQGGGCIINMSSGGATRAHRSFTAYDATKGGIEAFRLKGRGRCGTSRPALGRPIRSTIPARRLSC